jgi:hypothetical protein
LTRCAGCRPPGRRARDDHHAADPHTSEPIPPLRRSVARSSALARRHPKIIGNRPTAATPAANRFASASHHHAHATLQPTDRLFLLRLRPPAAVETSIAPSHYPAECTQSDAFVQPSLRARPGRANSDSFSGEAFITNGAGEECRLAENHVAFFPGGSSCTWRVTRPIKKVAILRMDLPPPFGLCVRIWHLLLRILTVRGGSSSPVSRAKLGARSADRCRSVSVEGIGGGRGVVAGGLREIERRLGSAERLSACHAQARRKGGSIQFYVLQIPSRKDL